MSALPNQDPAATAAPSAVDVAMQQVRRVEGVPLASVGGENVMWEDYEYGLRQALLTVSRQGGVDWSDPAMQQRLGTLQNQVLQQTVDRWLVRQLADESEITISEESLDEIFQEEKARITQSYEDWDQFLESSGLTEESFRQLVYDTQLVMRLMAAQDVETNSEQVHILHIEVEDEEAGEKAIAELRSGRSFADVAAEYSKDEQTKDSGGDLGWFSLESMLPELAQAAYSLEPGQFSGVIGSQFGYSIIQVQEREIREADAGLIARRQQEALFAAIEELRANTAIEYLVDFTEVEE
jgi:parvulin-like peptidyl-prolyl isomerase